jgi:ketosteroid isomerase-like protein
MTESADPSAVIEAHERFVRALEARDVETLVSLLDRSSEFLVFPSKLISRIDKIDEATRGFEKMFRSLGSTEWTEVHAMVSIRGEIAWHTSHLVLETSALEDPLVGRATEIWIRRVDGWKLVHGHWSEDPSGA